MSAQQRWGATRRGSPGAPDANEEPLRVDRVGRMFEEAEAGRLEVRAVVREGAALVVRASEGCGRARPGVKPSAVASARATATRRSCMGWSVGVERARGEDTFGWGCYRLVSSHVISSVSK